MYQDLGGTSKLPEFLIPSAVSLPLSLRASVSHQSPRLRSYASLVGQSTVQGSSVVQDLRSSGNTIKAEQAVTRSSGVKDQWLALLEPLLPNELRSLTVSSFRKVGLDSGATVPDILHRARQEGKVDLLSYLGIDQGRWKAVSWVVGNLIPTVTTSPDESNWAAWPSQGHWLSNDSLDKVTDSSIWLDYDLNSPGSKNVKLPSLDDLTGDRTGRFNTARDRSLRQIWQSIGSMILRAADCSEDKSAPTMSNVYQIIAYLHNVGAMPTTMYNYAPPIDPAALQRPPTLTLLSARILTTLSDAVWRAKEKEAITKAAAVGAELADKGYVRPSVRSTPRVRDLGHAVWLDLVLWACVESGYVSEGAWILNEMKQREGDKRWSTTNWKALQEASQSSGTETEWIRWFTTAVPWTNEGYSRENPLVEMGSRTISSEVVTAIIDGLLNTARAGSDNELNTPGVLLNEIVSLKTILERDSFVLSPRTWNSVILRLLESHNLDPEVDPASLERLLALAPMSTTILGLLHRTLHAFAARGNIRGARRVFACIQTFVLDSTKDTTPSFVGDLKRFMHAEDEGIYYDAAINDIPDYFPNVPGSVFAAFINLITESKAYALGRWLLYSEKTGGPVTRFFADVAVAPSLLRFAAATSDSDLLAKVISGLDPPLPVEIIRALFHCNIALGDWAGVEELLVHFKQEQGLSWSAAEATALAREVLLLEQATLAGTRGSSSPQSKSFGKAKVLLQKLLRGEYNTARLAYERRDDSQVKLVGQLIQILGSVPGVSRNICEDIQDNSDQASTSARFPVEAFNILLDAVVSTRGSLEAKRMWDTWCKKPGSASKDLQIGSSVSSRQHEGAASRAMTLSNDQSMPSKRIKIVEPNLATLRTILRGAVLERKAKTHVAARYFPVNGKEAEQPRLPKNRVYRAFDLLKWGALMFRRFGLNENEVDAELGRYLRSQSRRFVRKAEEFGKNGVQT
ncbi:hypothetical protein MMC16_000067 [Acarospora aff. strigata]|nr:hypothetical protein [Acarospora aff. strigata]